MHKRIGYWIALLTHVFVFATVSFGGTFGVLGLHDFTRGTGTPVTLTHSFTVLNPNASYTLKIINGGVEDLVKVSSALIMLNGNQVVSPDEFNQNVAVVEKPVTLASNNDLSVEIRGKPGGVITIEIIGVDDDAPTVTITSPEDGDTLSEPDVTVTGDVSDLTSGIAGVTCNGVAASVTDSIFSCDLTLNAGTNTISAVATDKAGNMATASINVTLTLSTLAGIDTDNDGVRDDIQQYIAVTYPDSEQTRAALTQRAKSLQETILHASSRQDSISNAHVANRAIECIYARRPNDAQKIDSALLVEFLDTEERIKAYFDFNAQLGGEVFPISPLNQFTSSCVSNN